MSVIDDVVVKLFGKDREEFEIDSIDYMKKSIRNAPDIIGRYHQYTSDDAIKDFLFEQTDLAKLLKKYIEDKDDSTEEENT